MGNVQSLCQFISRPSQTSGPILHKTLLCTTHRRMWRVMTEPRTQARNSHSTSSPSSMGCTHRIHGRFLPLPFVTANTAGPWFCIVIKLLFLNMQINWPSSMYRQGCPNLTAGRRWPFCWLLQRITHYFKFRSRMWSRCFSILKQRCRHILNQFYFFALVFGIFPSFYIFDIFKNSIGWQIPCSPTHPPSWRP
jgi:hypothetical protein